jgi:hypothetical protein
MLRYLLAAAIAPALLIAQSQSVEVSLERNQGGVWKSIDPGLVLDQGDLLRFRFRTTFNGYLYVINSGTSGTQSLLYPGDSTGRNNRVQAGKDYFVPSTNASFQVAGPAGHDVVYWLVSPVALESNPAAALGQSEPRPTGRLIPRCDDSIFRARGLCIDSSAGPRNVGEQEDLPGGISAVPNMTKRELLIVQDKDKARVSSPSAMTGPVIYEFRVAHR